MGHKKSGLYNRCRGKNKETDDIWMHIQWNKIKTKFNSYQKWVKNVGFFFFWY